MTEIQSTRSAPVLVGIDIAKNRHEVLIEAPGRKRRRRVTMLNTRADFDRLTALLLEHDRLVRVAFEATGNYHRALAWRLIQAGFETKLVSSVGLARTREALHNGWDKNDPKDAQVILHMLSIGADQFYHDPPVQGTNDIQELSKTHDIVSKSKTELWHRILTHYLPLYFPEADRFHRSSRSDWLLAFLERYPSPHFISAMSREAFIADAWNVIGRRVSKERLLSDIYDTAASSVGLPVGPDSDAMRMFRMVLAEGRSLIEQREIVEAILYLLRAGCSWRLLPHDSPPWQTVYYYLRRWQREGVWARVHHTLVMADREGGGREASPSAAIIDSQTVRTADQKGASKAMVRGDRGPGGAA
jgi:transposase